MTKALCEKLGLTNLDFYKSDLKCMSQKKYFNELTKG